MRGSTIVPCESYVIFPCNRFNSAPNNSTFTTIKRDIDWWLTELNDRIREDPGPGATTESYRESALYRIAFIIQGRVNKGLRDLGENSYLPFGPRNSVRNSIHGRSSVCQFGTINLEYGRRAHLIMQ